jgi:hypothetical protein
LLTEKFSNPLLDVLSARRAPIGTHNQFRPKCERER